MCLNLTYYNHHSHIYNTSLVLLAHISWVNIFFSPSKPSSYSSNHHWQTPLYMSSNHPVITPPTRTLSRPQYHAWEGLMFFIEQKSFSSPLQGLLWQATFFSVFINLVMHSFSPCLLFSAREFRRIYCFVALLSGLHSPLHLCKKGECQ